MHSSENLVSDPPLDGWNRFWFQPADVRRACVLRIAVGVLAILYVFSQSLELTYWWGPQGLLPTEVSKQLSGGTVLDGAPWSQASFHFSLFSWFDQPVLLWVFHLAALLVLVSFTAGLLTRVTNLLAVLFLLSYVHRAPMLTGMVEPVLTMLLIYLCLAPCGRQLSKDARLWPTRSDSATDLSWRANLSMRLIQVHLAAFYLLMALSKLAGEPWWNGEAMWWLIAQPESRLIDLRFLYRFPMVFQAWTHAVVAFELAFPLLIWNHRLRPVLLGLSIPMWFGLALTTGSVLFCLTMVVAGLAFVPTAWLKGKQATVKLA